MPLIRLSVSKELTEESRQQLVDGLGEAMRKIPGKGPEMLMVDLEEGKTMYIAGVTQENTVFADIQYFSNFKHSHKQEFTAAAFEAVNKAIGTAKDKMFLTITERNTWGAFGDFRDEFYSE